MFRLRPFLTTAGLLASLFAGEESAEEDRAR